MILHGTTNVLCSKSRMIDVIYKQLIMKETPSVKHVRIKVLTESGMINGDTIKRNYVILLRTQFYKG